MIKTTHLHIAVNFYNSHCSLLFLSDTPTIDFSLRPST